MNYGKAWAWVLIVALVVFTAGCQASGKVLAPEQIPVADGFAYPVGKTPTVTQKRVGTTRRILPKTNTWPKIGTAKAAVTPIVANRFTRRRGLQQCRQGLA